MQSSGRTLVIETASEACSIALFDGAQLVAQDHRELGRGHAERLVPMIEAFPGKGRADQIMTSLGPGSFTGVRIGIAAARALGVAWGAKVLGYPTLALIAAMARKDAKTDTAPTTICVNGGHGEWFVQSFDSLGTPQGLAASLTPEAAARRDCHRLIAGNRARQFAEMRKEADFITLDILPDASRANLLPQACLARDLSPIYGRAPDAVPQSQRVRPA
ncbi:tRNA (adenosine(37)-N6)-threonylcarbamoyltransferase complex dimerization subunit type 1 TsaB [uncultured Erythrobacter sp.]|uniref:tRNA (adenosine(37)-N6)-threonylcarbamoyltransferase complex dimerization subunit type 1 TsaB n=1 Tax=uncultured Erythrobacter sp. TaxID=263913 RepID=UPI002627B670|nr:tRNA (adenosine(37)-N6)-threonylcarbamoyltransferase complex dimerization subunit type 1 TsaB [uncultured Erythrobacter sp.]